MKPVQINVIYYNGSLTISASPTSIGGWNVGQWDVESYLRIVIAPTTYNAYYPVFGVLILSGISLNGVYTGEVVRYYLPQGQKRIKLRGYYNASLDIYSSTTPITISLAVIEENYE